MKSIEIFILTTLAKRFSAYAFEAERRIFLWRNDDRKLTQGHANNE